jgi:8-oxo-dGTP pyrophosphatase MutT (NUDIX family)
MVRPFDNAALERLRQVLDSRLAEEIEPGEHRRAAVLILLIPDGDSFRILFSHRSPDLRVHSGQISFPGGGAEPGEQLELAALRETEEEIGVPPDAVELIGRLDDIITRTGFVVAPFVGILLRSVEFRLHEVEVTHVYEVPAAVLLDRSNPEIRYLQYRDRTYPSYFYKHPPIEIWGLTARILKGFLDLVRLAV